MGMAPPGTASHPPPLHQQTHRKSGPGGRKVRGPHPEAPLATQHLDGGGGAGGRRLHLPSGDPRSASFTSENGAQALGRQRPAERVSAPLERRALAHRRAAAAPSLSVAARGASASPHVVLRFLQLLPG